MIRDNGIYGAPDMVVEVLSPLRAYYDLKEKKGIYSFYGVKEYWIVDPKDKEVVGLKNSENGLLEFYRGNGSFRINLIGLNIAI